MPKCEIYQRKVCSNSKNKQRTVKKSYKTSDRKSVYSSWMEVELFGQRSKDQKVFKPFATWNLREEKFHIFKQPFCINNRTYDPGV